MVKRGAVYYVRLMVNGRDVWRSTRHTTLKMAKRKASELMVAIRNEEDFGVTLAPTFEEFWTKTYRPVYTLRKKRPQLDDQHVAAAMRTFGRKRLNEVTKSLCVRYLNERGKQVRPSTLNRERGTLQAIFERALEDGLIERNPWKGIEKEPTAPRIRVLTLENERLLRQHLTPRYQRWLTFMLGTGLRLEEARNIRLSMISFEHELIHVPASAAKGGKARSVPLFADVAQAVREQHDEFGMLWPAHQQEFRDRLQIKAAKAGIPHLSPHDLRHTFATRYLQGGGDIYVLSKILGHASVKMTEQNYVHLVKEDLVERSRHVELKMAS